MEPILQLVAQDHCSPWKKCDLFAPKSDFQANKNFEIQTLISDEKSGQSSFKYFGRNQIETFTYGYNTHTQLYAHTNTQTQTHIFEDSPWGLFLYNFITDV